MASRGNRYPVTTSKSTEHVPPPKDRTERRPPEIPRGETMARTGMQRFQARFGGLQRT